MATITRTVITYQCPRCKTDIGRQFGLITTLSILCPRCQTRVGIDRQVVAQNWGFNFAWVGGLLIWLALAVAVLASPEFAATVGNKTLPAATFENRVVIAGLCAIPALMAGLVVGGIGMFLGMIVSLEEEEASTEPTETSSWLPPSAAGQSRAPVAGIPLKGRALGQHGLESLAANYANKIAAPAAPPKPKTRNFFVRTFFVLLWPVVFFVAATSAIGLVMGNGADNTVQAAETTVGTADPVDAPQQQTGTKAGEKAVPWLLLGMLIVFVLGLAGLLPSTGRKIKGPRSSPTVTQPANPSGLWDLDVKNYPPAAPEPKRRNVFVRIFFTLMWPIVFFIVAAMIMSALAGAFSAETQAAQQQLHQQSAERFTGGISLASLLLFVLGCSGVLPKTGAWKKSRAAE